MAKRTVFSFLFIVVISAMLIFRIAFISDTLSSDADASQSSRRIPVDSTRGMIYDRYMLPLVNEVRHKLLFVNPTDDAVRYLQNELDDDTFAQIKNKIENGTPFVFACDSYEGYHDDITELSDVDRYSENPVAVHLTGYLDSQGKGVCGIEKDFDSLLTEYSGNLSVRYNASASGKALGGLGFELADENYDSQGGIVLTIDREIQRVCENATERNNMKKGAVVVLDAATSEILALVSCPEYDRDNLVEALNNPDLPFLNRALSAYPVGSVFKPVVAVAAMEKGVSCDLCFECTGSVNVSGVVFNCHDRQGHGVLDMTQAMAVSCNSYFIQLGQKTGAKAILDVAARFGLGKEIELSDSLVSDSGNLPEVSSIDSKPALANLSFGQGELLATPLQLAAMYCAFANGGYYKEPVLLKSMVDGSGNVFADYEGEDGYRIITDNIYRSVNEMLYETVNQGSGKLAKPMCCDASGKTATAETGKSENGSKKVHTWFVGFFPKEKPEYVIAVFREDGNYSSTDCAPVFRDIADGIKAE